MKCVHCDAVLSVPRGVRSARCPNCQGVTTIAAGGVTRPVTPPRLREAGYPRVNGHQRAVLIGINYTGTKLALSNPINDVVYMRHLLTEKYQFPENCILTLTDKEPLLYRKPTKSNILLAMRWLVHDCKPEDSLVFYFSGHSGQLIDQVGDGDEADRKDEAIRPVDWARNGLIRDDDINEALVRPLKEGVTLHAIIDASHSGTMLDLPMVYKLKQNGQPELRVYNPPNAACKNPGGGVAILISGCADGQKTVQIPKTQQHLQMGLFTYGFYMAAISAKAHHPPTYAQLLKTIKDNITRELQINRKLPNGRKVANSSGVQEPQISYSSKGLVINQHHFEL